MRLGGSSEVIENELKLAIQSGTPIIVISSWEENLVEAITAKTADALNRPLLVWGRASGFSDKKVTLQGVSTPEEALLRIRDAGDGAIALLKDFHPYLSDPLVVRLLRDIVEKSYAGGAKVVMSMPYPTIPVELEKDSAFLTLPLPGIGELKEIFKLVCARGFGLGKVPDELAERAGVAGAGLTRRQAERVFRVAVASAVGERGLLDVSAQESLLKRVVDEKRKITRSAMALEFRESGETFEDIGGLDELKRWLKARAGAFSERARKFGLPAPRGLLLLGIQGCGKSLTAKAVSQLWKIPLLRLDLSRIDPLSGEQLLMQALHTAEAVSPAVLWIDEIEKGFSKAGEISGGVSLRSLSAFITWLQEKTAPVYVVATANSITQLPPELLRKGRFDEIFFVNLPSRDERREIFRIHLAKRGRNPQDYDIELMAQKTEGFSGAEIEACVIAGMFEAFSNDREVTTGDILDAIQTTIPLSVTMEDEINAIRDWARGRARPASLDTRLSELLRPQPAE